ncbi:unnamed protein product [Sympodiomycopsis kandeliae]
MSTEMAPRPSITLIAALSPSNGLGKNGTLSWSLKGEMAYFRKSTLYSSDPNKRNAVIMGRNTWESIPPKFRPLKGRINVVVSRTTGSQREEELGIDESRSSHLVSSLSSALSLLKETYSDTLNRTFLIGGSQLYTQALESDLISDLLITRILSPDFDCDVFLPEYRTESQIQQDQQEVKGSNPLQQQRWQKTSYDELAGMLGGQENVQKGVVSEGDVRYEFQLWHRQLQS